MKGSAARCGSKRMPRSQPNAETVEGNKKDEVASPTTFTKFPKRRELDEANEPHEDVKILRRDLQDVEAWRVATRHTLQEHLFKASRECSRCEVYFNEVYTYCWEHQELKALLAALDP